MYFSKIYSRQFFQIYFSDNCTFKLDVIFVIDNSYSINGRAWNQVKGAVYYVVEQTVIGEDFVQTSVVTYDAANPLLWNLGDATSFNLDQIQSNARNMGRSSNIRTPAEALDVVNTQILGTNVDRADARNIVILISDGDESNTNLLQQANMIQQTSE